MGQNTWVEVPPKPKRKRKMKQKPRVPEESTELPAEGRTNGDPVPNEGSE